jgi:hypothetical protein
MYMYFIQHCFISPCRRMLGSYPATLALIVRHSNHAAKTLPVEDIIRKKRTSIATVSKPLSNIFHLPDPPYSHFTLYLKADFKGAVQRDGPDCSIIVN